jgi:hypothetical protein
LVSPGGDCCPARQQKMATDLAVESEIVAQLGGYCCLAYDSR